MIRLQAFGVPALFVDGEALHDGLWRQTRRFAVLIYLACAAGNRPHRRDEVIAIFWPESDLSRGRNALRQALHVIREELGSEVLLSDGSENLWVNPHRFTGDVSAFTVALQKGDWEAALSLYQGDFLEGFFLTGVRNFEFWVDQRRADLKQRAVGAAQNLAQRAEAFRDLEAALHWWRQALQLRPFHEGIICRIICLLAGSGNRGEGRAEFERFRSRLRAELGVRPSQETLDLVSRMSRGLLREREIWPREPRHEHGLLSRPPSPRPWRRPTGHIPR